MPRGTFTFEGHRYDVTAKTPEALAVKIYLRKKQLEEGSFVIKRNVTVKKWADEWVSVYKEGNVGDVWLADIKAYLNNKILPIIGNMRLNDVKQIHVRKIFNECNEFSISLRVKVYDIVNGMFRAAKENNLIESNPVDGIEKPTSDEDTSGRSLTNHERKHILELCKTHRGGLFFLLMLRCGLRSQEVVALKAKQIDIQKKVIKVREALKRDGTIGLPKSKAGIREVPIPDDMVKPLSLVLMRREPDDFICTQVSRNRHTKSSVRQMWSSFEYNLNIQMGCKTFKGGLIPPYRVAIDLVPHYFRHTYCTDLEIAGVPINVACRLMGHSSIAVTAKIYTHKSEEAFNDAADAINALQKRRNVGKDVGANAV